MELQGSPYSLISLVFLADATGRVLSTLNDTLGLMTPSQNTILQLIDPADRIKAASFLSAISSSGSALCWEMTVPGAGIPQVLQFSACSVSNGLLVMAVGGVSDLMLVTAFAETLDEELQASLLQLVQAHRRKCGTQMVYWDALMQLNNELLDLQRQLAKKNIQLERVLEEKNRVSGMVAHDLRNPLAIMEMYGEYLQEETASSASPQVTEFLAIQQRSLRFMRGMVDDLLDFSAIEAGYLRLERQETDPAALLKEVVTHQCTLARRKGIEIILLPVPACPVLLIDPDKIEQVLNNLISNAVKFSHAGQVIEVRLTVGEGEVEVAVSDHGLGISLENQKKIFQPFGGPRKIGTAGEKSTGLGLAIARRIVEGHGGHLRVQSVLGEGSAFTFSLPA